MNKPLMLDPKFPKVLTEEETLDRILAGRSCSRFGDGELRCATGGQAVSQRADVHLQGELVSILRGPTHSLVCLPHFNYGPRVQNWQKYGTTKHVRYMKQAEYGSAFITRPDNAPNIQTPEYWAKVRTLWAGKDVTLVVGSDYGSLNESMLRDTLSLKVVVGARRDAYSDVRQLEEQIGTPPSFHPIILCLGAAATVLAERLARKGCWAIDFGHVGKFMPKEYR